MQVMHRAKTSSFDDRMALLGATSCEREAAARIRATEEPAALIGELGSEPPQDLIEAHADHPERAAETWEGRAALLVTRRLAELDTPESRIALRELSRRPTGILKKSAVQALAESRDPTVAPDLIAALEDTDVITRRWAVEGLGTLRHRAAVPHIAARLSSDSAGERVNAAKALAQIGDPAALKAVRQARRRELRPWVRFRMPRRAGS